MIVEVYGKCDGVDIVFTPSTGNKWVCEVPADYSDGTYVVELWAVSDTGGIGYYTGILYMCNSRFAKLEIIKDGFKFTFNSDVVRVSVTKRYNNEFRVRTEPFEGGMMLVPIEFFLGEKKYIDMVVTSTNNTPVVITNSTYEIINGTGEVIQNGQCEIDKNKLSILYEPNLRGRFTLKVNYTVPPENRIARCDINVS